MVDNSSVYLCRRHHDKYEDILARAKLVAAAEDGYRIVVPGLGEVDPLALLHEMGKTVESVEWEAQP